jgi:hypothetical protein
MRKQRIRWRVLQRAAKSIAARSPCTPPDERQAVVDKAVGSVGSKAQSGKQRCVFCSIPKGPLPMLHKGGAPLGYPHPPGWSLAINAVSFP